MSKVRINITGMTCANCAKNIKAYLENKNIKNIDVSFTRGEISYLDNQKLNKNEIINLITELGYSVQEFKKDEEKSLSKIEYYFYISLIFTIPLFINMFLPKNNILHNPLIQFILCTPVYIIGLLYFGKSAYGSLKIGIPNMDVLIFLGSSSAFFYSIYGWFLFQGTAITQKYLFFETAATIITLVLLGNLIEKRSIRKTTTSINELSQIQAIKAIREIDGKIEEISFKEIKINDVLIVNTGDSIPTDGVIISGNCVLDESMITGESTQIIKTYNEDVIGGTVIKDGSIKIKAKKIGKETLLSQIIELVKDAEKRKPNIQKIGDKISSIFVPFVLIVSIVNFIVSHYILLIDFQDSLLRSIAVLVISCPCAMGLATPTAVIVGIGRAAKKGILIKGGETIERIASIKNIAFDKTGTLTTGEFIISKINIIDKNYTEQDINNIIYNLELHSSHPIAKSLCKNLSRKSNRLEIKEVKERKGVSISAKISGQQYTIGSSRIIKNNKDFDLFLLNEKNHIASIKIKDQLKYNLKDTFKKLKQYKTILLSGDKEEKCKNVAKELNIKHFFSEQLPNEKIKVINSLVNKSPTAMIGDGINDAPSLKEATVGISLGNATQIAIQSSDVILLNNKNLDQLPELLQIAKHTLLTIKQNLFWALSYNIIAIPLAICGLLNPMWGALFMAFSDIIVIGNSIRLRFKKIF